MVKNWTIIVVILASSTAIDAISTNLKKLEAAKKYDPLSLKQQHLEAKLAGKTKVKYFPSHLYRPVNLFKQMRGIPIVGWPADKYKYAYGQFNYGVPYYGLPRPAIKLQSIYQRPKVMLPQHHFHIPHNHLENLQPVVYSFKDFKHLKTSLTPLHHHIKPVVEHIPDDFVYDFRTKTHSYPD